MAATSAGFIAPSRTNSPIVVYLEGPDNVHVELVQHLEAGGH